MDDTYLVLPYEFTVKYPVKGTKECNSHNIDLPVGNSQINGFALAQFSCRHTSLRSPVAHKSAHIKGSGNGSPHPVQLRAIRSLSVHL